jgi:tetratricopeptide (TPR) repeat protein
MLKQLEKTWFIWLIAFAGSFILYGNTLFHQYALDDAIVITQNEYTKKGISGISEILNTDSFTGFFGEQKNLVAGGRYRPLSVVTFALEYQFFGANPSLSHFVNIFLYALTIVLIFFMLNELLCFENAYHTRLLAFLAAMLFMVHPLHTEVVANIKGRDEILSTLFAVLAAWLFVQKKEKYRLVFWILGAVSFFLALLSKENALAFLVLIPLAVLLFQNSGIKKAALQFLILLLPSVVFLIIRQNILGGFQSGVSSELMNNPFVDATQAEHLATIIYTWLVYFRLLVFPHPLTFDYYPYHIALMNFGNWQVWMALLLVLGVLVLGIKSYDKNRLIFYAMIGFAGTFAPVSNLLFPVGTFMNERFLYMPSVFWSLFLAWLLIYIYNRINKGIFKIWFLVAGGLYLIGFYSLKTIYRNQAWKNDFVLFTSDVKTSGQSAKSNCSAGGKLWEKGKTLPQGKQQSDLYEKSESYLRKAIKIHPKYADAWLLLGNVLFDSKTAIEESSLCYLNVLNIQPANKNAWQNLDIVLQQSTNPQLQLERYQQAFKIDSNRYILNYRLGVLYGRYFSDFAASIAYFKRAIQIDNTKAEAYKDLGTAYGLSGNSAEAYQAFKQATVLAPDDAQAFLNLATACFQLGRTDEANENLTKANQLKASANPN